jgi:hypothetical protein
MAIPVRRLVAVALAVLISACSSGRKSFDAEGLIAPTTQCLVQPSELGVAEKLSAINEGNGCEVPNPWKVYSLANVNFSQPPTINCSVAAPLNRWLEHTVQPAARGSFGEQVVSINIIDSYSCRPRNNVGGAKMSEHGFGNAVDIGVFTLESGRKVTVLEGWSGNRDERDFLRSIRSQACEEFMTVLGPGSDRYHRDHIHLDLQQRRSGKHYCH